MIGRHVQRCLRYEADNFTPGNLDTRILGLASHLVENRMRRRDPEIGKIHRYLRLSAADQRESERFYMRKST